MNKELARLIIIFVTFVMSYWALLGIDFSRFLRKGRTVEAQILCVLLAMALTYLVVEFLFSLQVFMI